MWPTIIIAGVVGTLVAGICYQPKEVFSIILAIIRGLWSSLVAAGKSMADIKPLGTIRGAAGGIGDTAVTIAAWMKEKRRGFGIFLFVVLTLVTFVVISRFATGWAFSEVKNEDSNIKNILRPWAMGFVVSAISGMLFCLLLGLLSAIGEDFRSSWWMPISIRVAKRVKRWFGDDEGPDPGKGKKWSTKDFLEGWFYINLIPIVAPLAVTFSALMLAIDVVSTLFLALASTERLAAMVGALIGTTVGLVYSFNSGSAPLVAIAVGGAVGGISGRLIYMARCALAYKPSVRYQSA
jgi:hypothetical protein